MRWLSSWGTGLTPFENKSLRRPCSWMIIKIYTLVELIGVKNEAKTIRLTRIFKETREVILDTPSALMMGGRFKNATPVTACAFVAMLMMFCIKIDFGRMSKGLRQHDVDDAINYKARQKPFKRQSLWRKVKMSSDGTSTRRNPQKSTGRPMQSWRVVMTRKSGREDGK